MAEQEFLFGQELTLDRATAPGTSPMPTDIRGVVSEAPGVMRARGALASVVSSALEGFTLVGCDDLGVASFKQPGEDLAVLRDSTIDSANFSAIADDAWHVPGAGVAYNYSQHLLYDLDGNKFDSNSYSAATISYSTPAGSGDIENASWDLLIIQFIHTKLGKFKRQASISTQSPTAAQVIQVSMAAHANGSNYRADVYIRPDDDFSPYVLAGTIGSGESLTISDFPVGIELEGGNVRGTTLLDTVFAGNTVMYRGRVYGRTRATGMSSFITAGVEQQWAMDNWPSMNNLVVFSTRQYLNLVNVTNFVPVTIPGSGEVTGLASAEQGVFVFGDNGAGIIYGDPDLALFGRIENFGQRAVNAGLGHDNQQPPALLGGTPFHVWRGRVYMIDGNSSTEVSARIYNADDEFKAVVADSVNKLLLCLTENNNVFIYDAVQRMWLGDSASDGIGAALETVDIIVPNATHGTVYLHFNPIGGAESTVLEAYGTASFEDMVFDFDDFSMGDRFRRDLWVALEVFIENTTGTPTLSFDTESGDSLTLGTVNGRRRDEGDLWDFVFPWGIACRMGDWALTIPSDGTTRAYLPWKFRYIDREDSRWGKDDEAP